MDTTFERLVFYLGVAMIIVLGATPLKQAEVAYLRAELVASNRELDDLLTLSGATFDRETGVISFKSIGVESIDCTDESLPCETNSIAGCEESRCYMWAPPLERIP